RKHLIEGETKDWDAFYAACVDDTPVEAVIAALLAHADAGHEILIMSGRSDQVHEETLQWLDNHVFFRLNAGNVCNVRMRPADNFTPDHELKMQWLRDLPRERILCAYEDRDKVVSAWRAAGIPCFQVAPGDF
ncbi:MAG: hypothetical protein ACREUF_19235, partial [Solimonas sp.]